MNSFLATNLRVSAFGLLRSWGNKVGLVTVTGIWAEWPDYSILIKKEGLAGPAWQSVVKTPGFQCRERGFDPWSGN